MSLLHWRLQVGTGGFRDRNISLGMGGASVLGALILLGICTRRGVSDEQKPNILFVIIGKVVCLGGSETSDHQVTVM
jgi:hypothetical protein